MVHSAANQKQKQYFSLFKAQLLNLTLKYSKVDGPQLELFGNF